MAPIEEDFLDAALYLAHSFHILGLSKSFNLLLSVIVNEKLAYDKCERLIILLARAIEPRNAESYIDTYGSRFRRRYELYREGLSVEALLVITILRRLESSSWSNKQEPQIGHDIQVGQNTDRFFPANKVNNTLHFPEIFLLCLLR